MPKKLLAEAVSIIKELVDSILSRDFGDHKSTRKANDFLTKIVKKKINIGLSPEQKRHIHVKVKELGSVEKVKEFYGSGSLVCSFAVQVAEELF